ncbi:MAG TPA: metallophosphoesterase [Polyangiaceae bacterium]|nr:metallophosphoesterase [Polyangiaceae bacterium]
MRQVLAVAAVLVAGCLKSTPFQGEPSETDLTAHQLQKLRESGEPRGAWSFLAFGDTHDEYDELERAVGLMNQSDARLALIAGDLADRGTLQEFEWSVEQYLKLKVPFVTTIGNHDELSGGVKIYERMYGPREYSFVYGGLKFVVFDSNTLENPQAPRRDWLTAQVEDHGDAKVVLLMHQAIGAPDDVEGGTNRAFYDELLQSGDVALVVHGHLDAFQLRRQRGVPVLQCGTFQTQFLYTRVRFDGDSFSFETCHIEDCEPREPQAEAEAE